MLPLPETLTVSGNCDGLARVNVAVTSIWSPGESSIVHTSPHSPKPSNTEPGSAFPVSVTGW